MGMDAENGVEVDVATVEQVKPDIAAAATSPATPLKAEPPVLPRLLEIADAYFAAGAVHQAMEIYFELVGQYSDAPEGTQAGDRLMNIARRYVSAGMLHQARAVYERLV